MSADNRTAETSDDEEMEIETTLKDELRSIMASNYTVRIERAKQVCMERMRDMAKCGLASGSVCISLPEEERSVILNWLRSEGITIGACSFGGANSLDEYVLRW